MDLRDTEPVVRNEYGDALERKRIVDVLVGVLIRFRLWVIGGAVVAAVMAAWVGHDVAQHLVNGGMESPQSESARASAALTSDFPDSEPNLVLLAHAERPVTDPQVMEAGLALVQRLERSSGATSVTSFWTTGDEALLSEDGRTALVTARLPFGDSEERAEVRRVLDDFTGAQGPLQVEAGGPVAVSQAIEDQSQHDLHLAELLAIPLTLLLMLLVFRGALAAALPVLVGVISVAGALAVLRALTEFQEVSVFALNITTAIGFAMGIDFSLFVVARFREELAAGRDVAAAVAASTRKAGHIVVFSASISILTFAGLLVFPLGFLRSIAYAAIAVLLLAAIVSLAVLPAMLAVIGRGIDRFDVFARLRPAAGRGEGFWHRTSMLVMKRPIAIAVPVVLLLLLVAAPVRDIEFSLGDDRLLPSSAPAYQATETWRADFPTPPTRLDAVLSGHGATADPSALDAYARRLSELPTVDTVEAPTGRYTDGENLTPACDPENPSPECASLGRYTGDDGVRVAVAADIEPTSSAATDLVHAVRAEPAPAPVLVGGTPAALIDTQRVLTDRLPFSLLWIAVWMLVLLFLLTRSVFLPVKAILLNLLSLTATFGAIVFVFQEGHLRWLVGDFQVTGTTNLLLPILVFCLAFGLSMDYEVLLLSRIRDEYLLTGETVQATARGLERTGWLFTSSAAIVASVSVCLATSDLTPLKLLGVGLTLAVLLDATLIRGLLAPAVMRMAGAANWWAPRWSPRNGSNG
jgi:putative drug exporter of the RND superfamily